MQKGRPKKRETRVTDDQRKEIRNAYELFDPDHRGYIDYHELKVIMRALGFDVRKSDVLAMLRDSGVVGSHLTLEQYTDLMVRKYGQRDPVEEIFKAFKLFDEEGSGKISLRNLRKVARELGENLTEEELEAMIEEFDRDGDGQISEEEFMAIMRSSQFY